MPSSFRPIALLLQDFFNGMCYPMAYQAQDANKLIHACCLRRQMRLEVAGKGAKVQPLQHWASIGTPFIKEIRKQTSTVNHRRNQAETNSISHVPILVRRGRPCQQTSIAPRTKMRCLLMPWVAMCP